MPPLVYDAPAHETTSTTSETKPVVKSSLFVETNNGDDSEDSNNEENDNEDESDVDGDDNEDESEVDEDDNEDKRDVDEDDMFVLTDDQKPVRCSDDYHALCRYRDHLVQKETRQFHDIGAIYVSHNKEETVLSYKDRNLIWNTERILKTFTIHRINKI